MPTADGLKDRYFQLGTEYYATARFAAIRNIGTVSGLLFHYAIEMFLKGHLCLTLKDQERKNIAHRLEDEVWPAFKNMVHDSELDRYDRIIHAIDVFWDLRYPEDLLRTGMTLRVGIQLPSAGPISTPTSMPHFELVVDDVDRLVAVIFEKSHCNPKYFEGFVLGEARDYLAKENKTDIW